MVETSQKAFLSFKAMKSLQKIHSCMNESLDTCISTNSFYMLVRQEHEKRCERAVCNQSLLKKVALISMCNTFFGMQCAKKIKNMIFVPDIT